MSTTLDVRGLAHHQRPPLIFKELSSLNDSEEIESLPMSRMLEEKGNEYRDVQEEKGSRKVTIVKKTRGIG